MKISIIAFIAFLIFIQARKSHQPELNMSFVNWMKSDPKLIFTSNKGDTVKFEIDGHALLVAKDHRLVEYHKQAKDTNYYHDFIIADTFPHHSPKFTILFEGCLAEANGKAFTHKHTFLGAELQDVAEFEVQHDNHRAFRYPKKEVKKMWWSVSKGLLKYETKDGLMWIRQK